MTGIDKMVVYLDSSASIGATRSENIRIAKRLAAEEDKQKPTAPASLVEEVGERVAGIRKALEFSRDNKITQGAALVSCSLDVMSIEKILSRYRPSTQADIVGELRKHQEYLRECNCDCCTENIGVIEEIIRKHEGAK